MRRRQAVVVSIWLAMVVTVATGQDNSGDNSGDGGGATGPGGLRISAGHTESRIMEDGAFLKRYSGGVHAVTLGRDAELTADVAQYDSRLGEGRFYGGAAFRDSTRHLNADTLIYYEDRAEVEAIGNVLVTETGRLFRADRVHYYQERRLVFADGAVIVRDDSLKASITGAHAVFDDSTGAGMVTGRPVLVREDEVGSIITVTCEDTLDIRRPEKLVDLWAGVVITQDSLTATGDHARYDGNAEVFTLTGNPDATLVSHDTGGTGGSPLRSESVVAGDTIRVRLAERKVRGVEVTGGARNTTVWNDSTGALHSRSILESTAMQLVMADNRIDEIIAEGMAKSYYFQDTPDEDTMFVNDASGDTLRFFFEEGHISWLRISGTGGAGAKGTYYEYSPAGEAESGEPGGGADAGNGGGGGGTAGEVIP